MSQTPSPIATALKGRYRIEREPGAGTTALVCLANDIRHHRDVALEALRPELAAAIGVARSLREVGITARLSHPCILPRFDSGAAAGGWASSFSLPRCSTGSPTVRAFLR